MTLKQSSAVHIQALYSADGILPGSSSKLQLLVINLASVPGGQLVNTPTAQSRERWLKVYSTFRSLKNMAKLYLVVIALLIVVNNTAAQSLKITEKKLFDTFQKTVLKSKNGGITTGLSAWYSCNNDSAYFKLDTISLIHPGIRDKHNCCSSISWTFNKKDNFLETRFQTCKEPSTGSAARQSDIYQIRITTSTDSTFLTISNKDGKSCTFKILELIESSVENSERLSYELILKRWNY